MHAYIHTYITLHYITLHCIALHYITYIHAYIHTCLYLPTYVGTYILHPTHPTGGGGEAEVPCMIVGFQGGSTPNPIGTIPIAGGEGAGLQASTIYIYIDIIIGSQKHIYAEKLVYTYIYTQTHCGPHTQKLLHTEAVTHRSFCTQKLLLTDTFTHRHFYTQKFLHREAFPSTSSSSSSSSPSPSSLLRTIPLLKIRLHTNASRHKRFYTQTLLHTNPFTHIRFYTQTLLHTNAFTHGPFHTHFFQLHTIAFTSNTLTHKHFNIQTLVHTHTCFYTQPLLHTDSFTHKRFYTQPFYTQPFYTQTLWHRHPAEPTKLAENHQVLTLRKRCGGHKSQFYLSF